MIGNSGFANDHTTASCSSVNEQDRQAPLAMCENLGAHLTDGFPVTWAHNLGVRAHDGADVCTRQKLS